MIQTPEISRLWAGHLFGTNTGRLFLSLGPASDANSPRKGVLRVSDDNFGVSIFDIELDFEGDTLRLRGSPVPTGHEPEQLQIGVFGGVAKFSDSGSLIGEWETSIGTAGTFTLFPQTGFDQESEEGGPSQVYVSTKEVGALRLYQPDIKHILETLERKFPRSKAVISYMDRGAERSIYAEEFKNAVQNVEKLSAIRINIQAPAGGGFRKILSVDLGQAYNRVTTNGPDESWVLGEAEATFSFLREKEQKLSTAIGKYRLNVNQLIFLVSLVVMPELPLQQRAIFFASVIILILIADRLTAKLVPNFVLDLKRDRPNWIEQVWPTLLSWLVSVTSSVVASVIYGILAAKN